VPRDRSRTQLKGRGRGTYADAGDGNSWQAADAKRKIEAWRQYYNEVHPHSALKWATPAEYARRMRKAAQLHISPKPEMPKTDRD